MRSLSLVLLAAAACDGSDSPWFPSDLDRDSLISEASGAAAGRACQAFEDYLYGQYRDSLLVELVCTAIGVDQTTDAAACSTYVSDCIAQPPEAVGALITSVVDATGCGGLQYQPTGCGKTLADLAACLDAAERALQGLRLTLECTAAGQPLPPGALTIATPPECMSLEVACPAPG